MFLQLQHWRPRGLGLRSLLAANAAACRGPIMLLTARAMETVSRTLSRLRTDTGMSQRPSISGDRSTNSIHSIGHHSSLSSGLSSSQRVLSG